MTGHNRLAAGTAVRDAVMDRNLGAHLRWYYVRSHGVGFGSEVAYRNLMLRFLLENGDHPIVAAAVNSTLIRHAARLGAAA